MSYGVNKFIFLEKLIKLVQPIYTTVSKIHLLTIILLALLAI